MTYDQQILDAVASADRPLSHSEIADRLAPGDNRAWGRIGTSLTRLYRAGLLSREKIGHHFHYKPGDGEPIDDQEVHQVRVQLDQSIYVRGSIDEIAREAFQAGYARGKEEMSTSLLAACEPFARFYEVAKNTERGHGGRDADVVYKLNDVSITLGDLRRAAEAIREAKS